MTPREFRQKQEFEFNHFIELTSTGIKPNYYPSVFLKRAISEERTKIKENE